MKGPPPRKMLRASLLPYILSCFSVTLPCLTGKANAKAWLFEIQFWDSYRIAWSKADVASGTGKTGSDPKPFPNHSQTKIWQFVGLDMRLQMRMLLDKLGFSAFLPTNCTSAQLQPDGPLSQWLPQTRLSHPHQHEGLLWFWWIFPLMAKSKLVCLVPCRNWQRMSSDLEW